MPPVIVYVALIVKSNTVELVAVLVPVKDANISSPLAAVITNVPLTEIGFVLKSIVGYARSVALPICEPMPVPVVSSRSIGGKANGLDAVSKLALKGTPDSFIFELSDFCSLLNKDDVSFLKDDVSFLQEIKKKRETKT